MAQKIRVLVADNREIYRMGLADVLGKPPHIEVVAMCAAGEEAIRRTAELKPDIVILDGNITECDCFEVKRRIKEMYPEIRIIIINPASYRFIDLLSVL